MNAKNKKKQIEQKRIEQKKKLNKMKKEIKDLEAEINHCQWTNLKINTIKNLKITARTLQWVAPYVVTAGITAGGFTLLGDIPFYPNDKVTEYSYVMTEFDNNGNFRTEQQYESFENSNNRLYYYSKWTETKNGLYSRTVQIYKIDSKTYEEITELWNQENLKLEDLLGKPISNITETKNNLTEEEIQEEAFLQATIYQKDTDNYIIRNQTIFENVLLSLLYLLVTIIFELAPLYFRDEISDFYFPETIQKIKEQYPSINMTDLRKKLEIKQENYQRLTR